MSDSENGQAINAQLPPADAVEEAEEPVVDPDNDDGYEADDEGIDGWPQDPFLDEDNMSLISEASSDEGEGEGNGEQPEADHPDQPNQPDN